MKRISDLKERIQDWIAERAGWTKCPDLDDRVECPHPECGRRMLYRDIYEHFFAAHIFPEYPYQVDRKPEETTTHISSEEKFSVSDFVDDYELDQDQDEDDDLEIQDPTGGPNEDVRARRLRKNWKPYLEKLKSEGEVEIGPREKPLGKHGPRGSDAAMKLKSQVKRMDEDLELEVQHLSQGAIIKVKR